MKRTLFTTMWGTAAALCATVSTVHATSLTFDIYTNDGKTDLLPNNAFIPQSYGDNVNDFEPAGAFGANYYSYGTNGGYTPNITVEYGWFLISNPTNSFGLGFAEIWDSGYQGLTNVTFPAAGGLWYTYIAFTPSAGVAHLESFDLAKFGASTEGGGTLKLVQNALSANPITLWSAGPDGGVTFGARTNYTPNIWIDPGHTLYLVFGTSGNMGLDNITFSAVPEPTTSLLLMVAGAAAACRLSRCRRTHD